MDNLIIKEVTPEELEEMTRYSSFDEDKHETVLQMFRMLRTTRAFHNNLKRMIYVRHPNGDESVECLFVYRSGHKENISINVTADSCASLIQDVWKRMYELI